MLNKLGVFIFGFGAPASLEPGELARFFECATGRKPTEESAAGLSNRYRAIGGLSPMFEISVAQKNLLSEQLAALGLEAEVFFGMKCASPSIEDVVRAATQNKIEAAVAIMQAPQFAPMIYTGYKNAAFDAMEKVGETVGISFILSYGTHPLFIDAICARIRELFVKNPELAEGDVPFVFSAHSLPGNQLNLKEYVDDLNRGAELAAEKIGVKIYRTAFQSKGGGAQQWLGPSVEEAIDDIAAQGHRRIAVCPIGFIVDNLETLYDLDIAAAAHARSIGLEFYRAPALNDSPLLIEAWVESIVKELGEMI